MAQEMDELAMRIRGIEATGASTEDMWREFRNGLEQATETHIPQKTAKAKDSPPWLSNDLKRLIRKKNRLYKTKKKSPCPANSEKYKEVKALVQRELGRSYWVYIEDIVTPKEDDNQYNCMKRFWTFIKHRKS